MSPGKARGAQRGTDESLQGWLIERLNRESTQFPGNSAYFDVFPPRRIDVPPGYATDYLGNKWPTKFGFAASPGQYETSIPAVSEEYFEIIDIFEAVTDARGRFVMHEWGSGFARWTSLAVRAALDRGIDDLRCTCVEAEPRHLAFSIENLTLMGIPARHAKFYPFALGGKRTTDLFVVGRKESGSTDPWYGQALNDMGGYEPTDDRYFGRPVMENPLGFRAIEVMVEPASTVLKDEEFVDLVDMDIQGAEADAVEETIELLDAKVRRLHIGTHNPDVEQRLKTVLGEHGWILLRDLPHHARSSTPFGHVDCVDGVQSWFNPRFPPPDFGRVTA